MNTCDIENSYRSIRASSGVFFFFYEKYDIIRLSHERVNEQGEKKSVKRLHNMIILLYTRTGMQGMCEYFISMVHTICDDIAQVSYDDEDEIDFLHVGPNQLQVTCYPPSV